MAARKLAGLRRAHASRAEKEGFEPSTSLSSRNGLETVDATPEVLTVLSHDCPSRGGCRRRRPHALLFARNLRIEEVSWSSSSSLSHAEVVRRFRRSCCGRRGTSGVGLRYRRLPPPLMTFPIPRRITCLRYDPHQFVCESDKVILVHVSGSSRNRARRRSRRRSGAARAPTLTTLRQAQASAGIRSRGVSDCRSLPSRRSATSLATPSGYVSTCPKPPCVLLLVRRARRRREAWWSSHRRRGQLHRLVLRDH